MPEKQGLPCFPGTTSPKQLHNGNLETPQHTQEQGGVGRHTYRPRGASHGPLPSTSAPRVPKLTLVREASCLWTQVEMLRQTEGHAQPHLPDTPQQWPLCTRTVPLSCPRLPARSLPDPGYKYLPLHPGGIRCTQATMATAPPLPTTRGVLYNTTGVRLSQEPHPHRLPCILSWKL